MTIQIVHMRISTSIQSWFNFRVKTYENPFSSNSLVMSTILVTVKRSA